MARVIDDIKNSKGYILGVVAFATAISAFLTTVLGLAPEPTLISVAGGATVLLYIGWLIQKSEQRQSDALKAHEDFSLKKTEEIAKSLETIKEITIENQRASIRIEMNDTITRTPDNHDTILRYAERYFGELDGDWVETDLFMSWVDSENNAGRKVHANPELMKNITAKYLGEHKK